MIHKVYKPDGSKDLRRWRIECDGCHTCRPLFGSAQWFVPAHPNMPDYCPFCLAITAAYLIERAFT